MLHHDATHWSKLVPLLKEGSRRGKFRKAVLTPLKSVKFINKSVKKRYLGEHLKLNKVLKNSKVLNH